MSFVFCYSEDRGIFFSNISWPSSIWWPPLAFTTVFSFSYSGYLVTFDMSAYDWACYDGLQNLKRNITLFHFPFAMWLVSVIDFKPFGQRLTFLKVKIPTIRSFNEPNFLAKTFLRKMLSISVQILKWTLGQCMSNWVNLFLHHTEFSAHYLTLH